MQTTNSHTTLTLQVWYNDKLQNLNNYISIAVLITITPAPPFRKLISKLIVAVLISN